MKLMAQPTDQVWMDGVEIGWVGGGGGAAHARVRYELTVYYQVGRSRDHMVILSASRGTVVREKH